MSDITYERHPVVTDRAPRPLAGAPYSQAIASRGLVFCSGQIPLDPESQQLVSDDVAEQTQRVLRNLQGVLEAAGTSLDQVCKTTVFLTDIDDFAAMNDAYTAAFGDHRPARSAVAVAALPLGALVEVEAWAWVGA